MDMSLRPAPSARNSDTASVAVKDSYSSQTTIVASVHDFEHFFVTRCDRLLCLKAKEEVEVESWTFKFWMPLKNSKRIANSATFLLLRTRNLHGRGRYKAPGPAVAWIAQVFLGLEHMHLRMDTLLRDLKPDNVVISASTRFRHFWILQNHILSSYSPHRMILAQHVMFSRLLMSFHVGFAGDRGVAKLTDFGFGRFGVEGSSGTWSFGIPAGSPGYVAPEVILQRNYDHSAMGGKDQSCQVISEMFS